MRLNEQTSVPLQWVAVIGSTLVGITFWVGTVYWQGTEIKSAFADYKEEQKFKIEEIKKNQDDYNQTIIDIEKKIERILVKVENLDASKQKEFR